MGRDVSVKDLAYYFDWDNDGIAGNELDESPTVHLSQNNIDKIYEYFGDVYSSS